MRILQVCPKFHKYVASGSTKVVYDISQELVKRGHSVTVYTSDMRDKYSRVGIGFENVDGISVYRFQSVGTLATREMKLFITPGIIPKLKSEIQSFDVIHLHEYQSFQNTVVCYYAKKYGIPYVLQAHGSIRRIEKRFRKWLYDVAFGYRILQGASNVVALSDTEAKDYEQAGVPRKKIAIIPNGINLSEYAILPSKGCFKKKYGISEDEKIILYLGRINKIKGTDFLVEAYANLINNLKCKAARLVIVGPDDGYLRKIQALIRTLRIENDVLILKPMYGMDKLEAYVDADMYVLPSRYETFPMSVLEAVACRTPVILTENCGVANYFNEKIGLISKPDSKHLCEALLKMLLCKNKQDVFRENCKITINEFNISNVTSKLEKIYEEIGSTHTAQYTELTSRDRDLISDGYWATKRSPKS